MKKSFNEIMQIKDLYNLDSLPFTTVIAVLENAYIIECILEVTVLNQHEWLKAIADLGSPIPGWWEKYEGLWNFRGELAYCSKHMSFQEAVETTLQEWVYK